MKAAWTTDIHLDQALPYEIHRFYKELVKDNPDVVLISGDITQAPKLKERLLDLRKAINSAIPIYFVLGNHDYYRCNIQSVRNTVIMLCNATAGLHWLPTSYVVKLTESTALVGHDGWADGLYGDWNWSQVRMNDDLLIHDFLGLNRVGRLYAMQQLANETAEYIQTYLTIALKTYQRAIFLTHVPPFVDACRYKGRPSDADYLPYFASKTIGDALIAVSRAYPDKKITVLCGHAHGNADIHVEPNITVMTGEAEYGHPRLQQTLEID